MSLLEILNYISVGVSNITFILVTYIILLVSACFLGRYVVVTKKMIFATFGTIILTILTNVISSVIMIKLAPELLTIENNSDLSPEAADVITKVSNISSAVLNIGVFIYAFVIYLIAFKEKKVLRSIEAIVILYLYYGYINNMVLYATIFLSGGDYENIINMLYSSTNTDYETTTKLLIAYVGVCFIVTVIVLLLLYFGYYKKGRFYVLSIKSRIFFVVWLLIFYLVPGIPFYDTELGGRYKLLCYLFGIIIPVLGFIAPSLLVLTAAEKSLKEKNEYQETYLAAELEYIEQYKRSQTETRAFRHDIINNLSLTSMMLDEGRTEEAGEHLKSLLGNVRSLSPTYITGDEMLDCIVAMKAEKMNEMGIRFSLDGVIDGGLNMKPMSVCSIFANALDNAIEASSHLLPKSDEAEAYEKKTDEASVVTKEKKAEGSQENGEATVPFVDMKIKRTEKFFIINIKNAAQGEVDVEKLLSTSGYTSKKDTEHHGFGLRNIRKAIEEYNGILRAESSKEDFSLSILVPR